MSSISDCPPAVWPSESSTQRLDDLAGHGVQPPATDQPPTTDQPPAVAAALFQESPDAWRSAEALLDELDRLIGREWQKKRDTVLALVDARLAGRSEETVWDLPQTCNRSTYHSKWKRNDPIFVDVLDKCTKIAKRHKDRKPARAVVQAGEYLQLAAPAAAGRMVALIDSSDEAVALRAAAAVRAGTDELADRPGPNHLPG